MKNSTACALHRRAC